jgi:CheY-like chemotaxis protein
MNKLIVMLEDDSDDRYLTEEIFSQLNIDAPIRFFSSSLDLFPFIQTNRPSLILLDYNSTPENAVQVLKKIKGHPELKDIPVIVLSDNDLPAYKNECYSLGASSFIKKPSTLEGTRQKIETFFKYWFEVAEV